MLPKLWIASDNVKAFLLNVRNIIQDKFYDYDTLRRFSNSISKSLQYLSSTLTTLSAGGLIISAKIASGMASLTTNLIFRDDYKNEQFADNFATAYGYGAETIQLQQIFATIDATWAQQQISKIKIMSLYFDYIKNISSIFQGFHDCHPSNMDRALDQVKYLEQNLKYLPKENRKEIQAELDRAKEQLKIFRKACDNDIILAGKYFTATNARAQYRVGGDIAYKVTKNRDKNGQWGSLV